MKQTKFNLKLKLNYFTLSWRFYIWNQNICFWNAVSGDWSTNSPTPFWVFHQHPEISERAILFFFFFFENFAQSLRGKIPWNPWNQIMFSGKLCLFYSGIFRWASHLLLRTIVYNYIIKVYEINFTVLFECLNMVFIYPLGVLANELTAISWGPQCVYIVLESWGMHAMYSSQTDDITC